MATKYYSRSLGRVLTSGEVTARGLDRPATTHGLGDLVARLAEPIARWLDARLKVWPIGPLVRWAVRRRWASLPLAKCSACSARRRALNVWLPDVRSWASWLALARRIWGALKARLTPP